MSNQDTFLDELIKKLRKAGTYNTSDQAAPAAILWPDKERQWEPLLPLLREHLPLLTFGTYKPEERTGPAYWLRCMIARTLPADLLPEGQTPIIYLPGVSRQELKTVEDLPKMLKPLVELQYRGMLWTHRNGKDWTLDGFLQSPQGGLGIEMSTDVATRIALQRALLKLIDEPVIRLKKEAPLRADFFNALLHPDEVRNLLLWLNDAAGYKKRCNGDEWASFCDLCKRKYDIALEENDRVAAMRLFGEHQGAWEPVWQRFKEAPHAYPYIPELLRNADPQQPSFPALSESWPQDNEAAELELRERLAALRSKLPDEVRVEIKELEKKHAARRNWVWASLGRSPLAMALQHLVTLAQETERFLAGNTVKEIIAAYTKGGWKADAAVIDALASIERVSAEETKAVNGVIAVLYRPWLEKGAEGMQKAVGAGAPAKTYPIEHIAEPADGTCILFCDGLRYDVGQRLVKTLETQDFKCNVESRLAALPTITPTAKPAVSPVASQLSGKTGANLEVFITKTGTKATIEAFRKLLEQNGYQILKNDELGDPSSKAWAEMGAIDSNGHSDGWKLAYRLNGEVDALKRRIEALLEWGWRQVIIVTDHGWLLFPEGLPKADLPEHLTYLRKGRCAQLKEAVTTEQQTVPWYWNSEVAIALAPGIRCYEAGKEYEHGGLSPQECIVPMITVGRRKAVQPISIESVTWRGLRCTMNIVGPLEDIQVDIRSKAGDPKTSLIATAKSPNADGTTSLLIEDEDRVGEAALIVILSGDGTVRKQTPVIIGG
jgi:PglZ domain